MDFQSGLSDAKKAGYENTQVISQKSFEFDVPYKFRILNPILPKQRILYPCVVPDDKNPGQVRLSWREVRVPFNYERLAAYGYKKQATIIDVLRDIDLQIRRARQTVGSAEDIRSYFDVQKMWVMPVYDRRDTGAPVIKYLEVTWQIYDALEKLEAMSDEDDASKLAHGPIWVHDVVLRKRRKEEGPTNIKDRFNVQYTADPAKGNLWAGKIDGGVLKDRSKLAELFEASVEMKIFTEGEYGVIKLFAWEAEMLPQFGPQSPTKIAETVMKAPIALNATNKDGSAIFPAPQEFAQALLVQEMKELGSYLPAAGMPSTPVESPAKAGLKPEDEIKSPAATEKTEPAKSETAEASPAEAPPSGKSAVDAAMAKTDDKPSEKKGGVPSFVSSLDEEV